LNFPNQKPQQGEKMPTQFFQAFYDFKNRIIQRTENKKSLRFKEEVQLEIKT
jgi:hypothetical protein